MLVAQSFETGHWLVLPLVYIKKWTHRRNSHVWNVEPEPAHCGILTLSDLFHAYLGPWKGIQHRRIHPDKVWRNFQKRANLELSIAVKFVACGSGAELHVAFWQFAQLPLARKESSHVNREVLWQCSVSF